MSTMADAEPNWLAQLSRRAGGVLGAIHATTSVAVGGLSWKLSHQDAGVRRSALEMMANLPNLEPHVPEVAYCLMDPDPSVRKAAVNCLGQLPPPSGGSAGSSSSAADARPVHQKLAAACMLLSTKPRDVLERARIVPSAFQPEVVSAIALLADGEQSHGVQTAATQSLGRLDARALPQHGELFVSLFASDAPLVRKAALEALGRMPVTALGHHVEPVVAMLDDADHHVRNVAAKVCAKGGSSGEEVFVAPRPSPAHDGARSLQRA